MMVSKRLLMAAALAVGILSSSPSAQVGQGLARRKHRDRSPVDRSSAHDARDRERRSSRSGRS